MIPKQIKDHSPADDYHRFKNQAVYAIKGVDYDHRKPYNNSANMKKGMPYRNVVRIMIALFIISGVCLVIAIVTNVLVDHTVGAWNVMRMVFLTSVIGFATSLMAALGVVGIGAFMESQSSKKDANMKTNQESKTWILNNGSILVSDEKQTGGVQMLAGFIFTRGQMDRAVHMPCQRSPFTEMKMIGKVYSVYVQGGYINADVDMIKYYIVHPYNGEGEDYGDSDISSDILFKYYRKRCRGHVKWDVDMQDANVLFNACERLKV